MRGRQGVDAHRTAHDADRPRRARSAGASGVPHSATRRRADGSGQRFLPRPVPGPQRSDQARRDREPLQVRRRRDLHASRRRMEQRLDRVRRTRTATSCPSAIAESKYLASYAGWPDGRITSNRLAYSFRPHHSRRRQRHDRVLRFARSGTRARHHHQPHRTTARRAAGTAAAGRCAARAREPSDCRL